MKCPSSGLGKLDFRGRYQVPCSAPFNAPTSRVCTWGLHPAPPCRKCKSCLCYSSPFEKRPPKWPARCEWEMRWGRRRALHSSNRRARCRETEQESVWETCGLRGISCYFLEWLPVLQTLPVPLGWDAAHWERTTACCEWAGPAGRGEWELQQVPQGKATTFPLTSLAPGSKPSCLLRIEPLDVKANSSLPQEV